MNQAPRFPKHPMLYLWTALVFNLFVFFALAGFSIYFQQRHTRFASDVLRIEAKTGRARERIQNETDISKLRSYALKYFDDSETSWQSTVSVESNVNDLLRWLAIAYLGTNLMFGIGIFDLARKNRTLGQTSLQTPGQSAENIS